MFRKGMYREILMVTMLSLLMVGAVVQRSVQAGEHLNAKASPFTFIAYGQVFKPNPSVLIENRVYLPLRHIAELSGLQVDFVNDVIRVEGEAQANIDGLDTFSLGSGAYSVEASPYPLVVRGRQIIPNPGVLIQERIYLPVRQMSDIIGIAIEFRDETVYFGEQALLYDFSQSVSEATPSATNESNDLFQGSVQEAAWEEGVEHAIFSLDQFKELLELMAANLGRTAYLRIESSEVALACHAYVEAYSLAKMESITLEISQDGGRMTMSYRPIHEVLASRKAPWLQLSVQGWQLSDVINQVLGDEIQPAMTDYEKEKAVHDFLIRHVEYDLDAVGRSEATLSSTAYGALVLRKAVCSGYAEAFKLVMDLLEVECHVVVGQAGGVDHAWNLVFLDGAYYQVDVTWDDPVMYDSSGHRVANSEPRYGYFNLTDDLMAIDHTWDRASTFSAKGTTHRLLRFDNSMEELLQGVESTLQQGYTSYSSRCLFFINSRTTPSELAEALLERFGERFGYSSLSISSDTHGTVTLDFS